MYDFYTEPPTEDILFQGDILEDLYFVSPLSQDTKSSEGAPLSPARVQETSRIIKEVLVDVKVGKGILVSQTCDMQRDSKGRSKYILICPVRNLSQLESKLLEAETTEGEVKGIIGNLRARRINDLFYLPASDSFEESYAELALITTIDKDLLTLEKRILSLTPYARQWFQFALSNSLDRPFQP